MSISVQDCLREIERQIEQSDLSIEELRLQNRNLPNDLAQLTKSRTESFVELAQIYLPELTHQTLANTWHEVRSEIRQVLLLRDDQTRGLRKKLDKASGLFDKLGKDLKTARRDLGKARQDLQSKRGNLEKALREDPQIIRLTKQIDRVDADIERGIRNLEDASSDAAEKLPDYEACHLFNYLQERKFGTPEYQETGFERRWDRWVARMIDYHAANKSYDRLVKTPQLISKLIDEKQDCYRSLLVKLEQTRNDAMAIYGIEQQERLIQQTRQRVARLEHEFEHTAKEKRDLERQLDELNGIQGEHYHRAIELYTRFLQTVEPETLAIYAACTETPVDDEICARIRDFDSRIADANTADQKHREAIDELRRYRTAIQMLQEKLQRDVNHAYLLAQDQLAGLTEPVFKQILGRLRDGSSSVTETLAEIRERLIMPAETASKIASPSPPDDPIKATFRAASTELRSSHTAVSNEPSMQSDSSHMLKAAEEPENATLDTLESDRIDPLGILIQPSRAVTFRMPHFKYAKLATCHRKANTDYVIQLLAKHDIQCFQAQAGRLPVLRLLPVEEAGSPEDWFEVMVDSDRFNDARRLILDALKALDHPWQCPSCSEDVPKGFDVCWNCGHARPTRE